MTTSEVFEKYFIGSGREVGTLAKVLYDSLKEGHSCIVLSEYFSEEEIKLLNASSVVGTNQNDQLPFFIDENNAYITRYFKYESRIVDFIKSKNTIDQNERLESLAKMKELWGNLFDLNPNEINWQLLACITSFANDFSVITGGPGTGKTTTVAKLLALLFSDNPDLKTALIAPTGKAAARLSESINNTKDSFKFLSSNALVGFEKLETATIHRILGYRPNSIAFKHNAVNVLPYDIIIVDESSMVDLPLMAKLIDAIGPNTKLILMGDKKQLASVEIGSVFGDICDAIGKNVNQFSQDFSEWVLQNIGYTIDLEQSNNLLTNKVIELQKSWRFSDDKGLGKFSKEVLAATVDCSAYKSTEGEEYVLISDKGLSKVFYEYLSHYRHYLIEKNIGNALVKLDIVRVLCSTKSGDFGVDKLNEATQVYLKNTTN